MSSATLRQEDRIRETTAGQGRQKKPTSSVSPADVSGRAAHSSSSRYQASTSTSSSSNVRRSSLFGTDDRVVLDIGSRVTKIGFSGEARPRDIFFSVEEATPSTSQTGNKDGVLWSTDLLRCRNEGDRRLIRLQLKARLTVLLRSIFYQRLLVDPKQRKVLVVENALMPTIVKQSLQEILFGNLQVSSVSFLPSHLLCTLAIGRTNSLVMDVGYHEATLLPIQFGRVLTSPHLLTSPRAGKRLSMRLRALLLHSATMITPASISIVSNNHSALASSRMGKIPAQILTPDFLDEIKAKTLFVGDMQEEVEDRTDTISQLPENSSAWISRVSSGVLDEENDKILMTLLESRYKGRSKAKDMVINISSEERDAAVPATVPSTIGAPLHSTLSWKGSILIPGWIRERAAEVLFEGGDEDELSLVEMILNALVKLPVDLRIQLAANIYIVGGTAMLPGLSHRLRIELISKLIQSQGDGSAASSSVALSLPRVGPTEHFHGRSPSNSVVTKKKAFDTINESEEGSGDSTISSRSALVGSNDRQAFTLESKAMRMKRRKREEFYYGPISSLAAHVAVLDDHAPRIDADGQPVGGTAPSFTVNLSSWIGASLLASLHVSSIDEKTRDVWDEEQEVIEAAAKSKSKSKGQAFLERPGLGAGKGSFLGSMSGLDLGTYGPLSASARSKFSSGSNPRSPPPPS
ncbi:hypothetical protein CBS101457_001386 [Exobasidium rhododendri]|nr:hypothetical protein CBS101457_001386 [Exobasidium rhododendri]